MCANISQDSWNFRVKFFHFRNFERTRFPAGREDPIALFPPWFEKILIAEKNDEKLNDKIVLRVFKQNYCSKKWEKETEKPTNFSTIFNNYRGFFPWKKDFNEKNWVQTRNSFHQRAVKNEKRKPQFSRGKKANKISLFIKWRLKFHQGFFFSVKRQESFVLHQKTLPTKMTNRKNHEEKTITT